MRVLLLFLLIPIIGLSQSGMNYLYSGEMLFHPGFKLSYEETMFSKEKVKKKKTITKSRGLSFYSGTYFHPNNHNHTFIGSNYFFKRTNQKTKSIYYQAGLGFGRITNLQPTYTLINGSLEKTTLAGRWTVFPTLEISKTYPAKFIGTNHHIKVSFWNQYQFPYNQGGQWYFGFDLGLLILKEQ